MGSFMAPPSVNASTQCLAMHRQSLANTLGKSTRVSDMFGGFAQVSGCRCLVSAGDIFADSNWAWTAPGGGAPTKGIGVTGAGGGAGTGVLGVGGFAGGDGIKGRAMSAAGAGMLAESAAGGTALRVSGSAEFSRS